MGEAASLVPAFLLGRIFKNAFACRSRNQSNTYKSHGSSIYFPATNIPKLHMLMLSDTLAVDLSLKHPAVTTNSSLLPQEAVMETAQLSQLKTTPLHSWKASKKSDVPLPSVVIYKVQQIYKWYHFGLLKEKFSISCKTNTFF